MANTIINSPDCPPRIIRVIAPGPKGDKGDKGDGFSGGSGSFTISGSLIISGGLTVFGGVTGSFFGSFTGSGDNLYFNRIGTNETGSSTLIIGNYNDISGAYYYRQTTVFRNGDVIVSGSLIVNDVLYAPTIIGSLAGTASWANYALTASYIAIENLPFGETKKLYQVVPATTWSFYHQLGERYPNITVFDEFGDVIQPGRIETIDEDTLNIYFTVETAGVAAVSTGGVAASGSSVTASIALTASWVSSSNVYGPWGFDSIQTASYALTASYFDGIFPFPTGANIKHFQLTPATTWSFSHDLSEQWPNVTVYTLSNDIIIPARVNAETPNRMTVYFDYPETGIVSLNIGGSIIYMQSGSTSGSAETASYALTASYAITASHVVNLGYGDTFKHFQTVPATTWSFTHNFGEQWPNVTVYDAQNAVIQPGEIIAVDTTTMRVQFKTPQTGIAALSVGGLATTSSLFVVSASYADYSLTASYVAGVTATFPYVGDAVITGSLTILSAGTLPPALFIPLAVAPTPIPGGIYYSTDGNLYIGGL